MATYAIGDIQGCFDTLEALLERCTFDPRADTAWLAGDLVNRGPRSLDVLRWARGLGARAVCVLGNHDLHLLARWAGVGKAKRLDTLSAIFEAPDCDELLSWLRRRPLLHREGGYAMVHAGLDPRWTLDEAATLAAEVEAALRGDAWADVLALERAPAPAWSPDLAGADRLRAVTAVMTRVRTLTDEGRLCSSFSGPPEEAPGGCHPWFAHPRARPRDETVVFGHWAALGYQRGPGYVALDSGCVWGGPLTAVRLDDGAAFQQPALE
jgi:bis(5'-nucleosyl)-tetraphosphatase (symmetrical)